MGLIFSSMEFHSIVVIKLYMALNYNNNLVFTEASADITAKKSDVTTLRGSFENVMRQHYPTMIGRIAVKLVPCPAISTSALGILSRFDSLQFFPSLLAESKALNNADKDL